MQSIRQLLLQQDTYPAQVMADSDDEFERKKGRDKFRRERNDYDRRSDDRRRESWDDR